jgi:hypothetical protein
VATGTIVDGDEGKDRACAGDPESVSPESVWKSSCVAAASAPATAIATAHAERCQGHTRLVVFGGVSEPLPAPVSSATGTMSIDDDSASRCAMGPAT